VRTGSNQGDTSPFHVWSPYQPGNNACAGAHNNAHATGRSGTTTQRVQLRSVDGSITHMAVAWRCELCGADLSVAVSCQRALRPGVVPFGSEFGSEHAAACRDCGVPVGGVHHLGCAVAWCSVHDAQRLRCDCDRELSPPTGGSKSLHPRELDY
jgi:hypothetical protein